MSDERELGDFIEVATYTNIGDARGAAAALEGSGLTVHLRNEVITGVLPHMADAFGGIGVCVPSPDAEQAREILAGVTADAGSADFPGEATPLEPAVAPAEYGPDEPCESPRELVARRAWRAAVLGMLFMPGVLQLISLRHVVAYLRMPGPSTPRSRRHVTGALLVIALFVGAIAGIVLLFRHPPPPPRHF